MSVINPFVAGQPLTAAQMNGLLAPWDAYTPTIAGFAVGNGNLTTRFYRQGKTVALRIHFTPGSTTTYSGAMSIGLPVAAVATFEQWLVAKMFNSSGNFMGGGYIGGSNVVIPWMPVNTGSTVLAAAGAGGPNPGTGGNLQIQGVYEAA